MCSHRLEQSVKYFKYKSAKLGFKDVGLQPLSLSSINQLIVYPNKKVKRYEKCSLQFPKVKV